ncbi:MAG: hypothetical protein HOP19_09675 [Acidobacteria bacterium]|nr:hypothetical protein [Acidobacteriota bacterium]
MKSHNSVPDSLPKLSEQTIKLINKLPDDTRAEVARVVRTHLTACLRNGSPVESLDRLFIEAVEVVNLEARVPEIRMPFKAQGYEPARHYDQYVSPREL